MNIAAHEKSGDDLDNKKTVAIDEKSKTTISVTESTQTRQDLIPGASGAAVGITGAVGMNTATYNPYGPYYQYCYQYKNY